MPINQVFRWGYPLISVIVPIYKSAQFIDDLMDSVLNQTIKDFELICVNDGSPDNSLALLQQWAAKDKRIVVIDKPNGGVSSARNAGIEAAKGDYIWFHDHDDYAFPDTLETMFHEADGRDFLIAGWLKSTDRTAARCVERKSSVSEKITANDIEEMRSNQPFNTWIGCIWRCLYKRSVLIEKNIRFRELDYEDSLQIYEFLQHCNSCARIDFEGYVHIQTIGSLGLSHSYCVNDDWLILAEKAAFACFKRFNTGERDSFCERMHALYSTHCVPYVTTGYHADNHFPFSKRMHRWNFLRKMRMWQDMKRYGYRSTMHKLVALIAKYRLYPFADPFLILFTRLYDKRLHIN